MAVGEIAAVVSIANSVLTIIKTLRREPTDADIERISAQILVEPETAAVMGISEEEGKKLVLAFGRLARDDLGKKFIDRIEYRCLEPFNKILDDHKRDDADLDEGYEMARHCVCSTIAVARKFTQGAFPSDELRELHKQFGCTRLG